MIEYQVHLVNGGKVIAHKRTLCESDESACHFAAYGLSPGLEIHIWRGERYVGHFVGSGPLIWKSRRTPPWMRSFPRN